ncbi:Ycf66 family protein [Synechocystis sp. CS-94]|nr:Ycf66 family protein [Synechocystis sp. CS-94]
MLSGAVVLASLAFFFSAFFAPKLHRKDDFLWSGVGFFYGLVLWNCAQRFTGAILLGQAAAVVLVLAFAWQTLRLRAAIAKHAIVEIPSFSLLDWLAGGLQRKPKVKTPVTVDDQKTPTKDKDNPEVEPVVEAVKQDLPETVQKPELVADSAPVAERVPEAIDQEQAHADLSAEVESVIETAETLVEELNDAAETVAEELVEKAEATVTKITEMAPLAPDQPETPTVEPAPDQSQSEEALLKKPKSKLFQRLFGRKKAAVPPAQPKQSQPETVEQRVSIEPESSTNQNNDWDDGEDWGEDPPSTENFSPVVENSDEVTDDNQENDETKVIAVVETVQIKQIKQQISLIELPDSENTNTEETLAAALTEEDQITQEEIVVDEVIAPIAEATAVEELPHPEINIEQDIDLNGLDEIETEPEEVREIGEAIASELEEVPEQTTDGDETTVNTDNVEEEETQNEEEEPTQEKQNWADG